MKDVIRPLTIDDCMKCGACCWNTPANVEEGYPWYVEIDDAKSKLLQRDDLRKKHVALDPEGVPHLRLEPSGRCAALQGRLGSSSFCSIYAHRPTGCRRVMPGDRECLAAREARGIKSRAF